MANLKLYTGKAPNTNGEYIYPTAHDSKTAFENFLTYLAPNLLATIADDNYRINNNTVRVAIDSTVTLANYKSVTYIVNELDNVCYIVKRGYAQSGCAIFDVTVDLWGTYIASASFDMINVARCNRRIGTGLYDQIRATNTYTEVAIPTPDGEYPTGYPLFYSLSRVYIVFSMTYNVEQTAFGATSATGLFAFNAKTLFDVYRAYIDAHTPSGDTPFYDNAIEVIIGIVSGIYGVHSSSVWGSATNDAKVTKAYLLPTELIYASGDTGIQLKSKSMYGEYTTLACMDIAHFARYKTLTLDVDPDYEYYVGTVHKGLKLVRTTDTTATVTYKCIPSTNDVEVVVIQGDNQADITTDFEVVLTMNDGDVTNLSGIKQALSMGLKGATAIASSGPVGVASLAPDVIGLMGHHYQGHQSGNGDGFVTFYKAGNATLYLCAKYPYGYVKYKSVNNEQDNAKYKGAFFDTYVATFASIFTPALLYGSNIATYIQANVALSNIPTDAQNAIRGALSAGIYAIKV